MSDWVQRPMFDPRSTWRPPARLPRWDGAKRIAIDVETRDEKIKTLGPGVRRGAYIVGVSVAIEDGPAFYLPIQHAAGDNLSEDEVLGYLRTEAAGFMGDVVGANLQYDLDFLEEAGVSFRRPRFFRDCIKVAEPLIDELQDDYSLDGVAARYAIPGKDEAGLRAAAERWGLDPKAELWKLPARHIGAYAEQDVRLPLRLLRLQERRIEEQDLWRVYDLESRVLPVLVKMRRRGVRIDQGKLDEVRRWSEAEEAKALEEVHARSGIRIGVGEVWLPEPAQRLLAYLGVTPPKTRTGKPSAKRDVFEAIAHPAAKAFVRARKVNKVRTSFVASIERHMVNGRIHCTFNQMRGENMGGDDSDGAAYGRLSAVLPNLQQQPARDPEIGPMWRSIYVPEEGLLWAACDYSGQEPRMTVHYASRTRCPGGPEMAARYRADPDLDLHKATADLCFPSEPDRKKARGNAKAIFLGLCYGMGGGKLCRNLGLPLLGPEETKDRRAKLVAKGFMTAAKASTLHFAGPEGQAIIDQYHAMVPFVRDLARKAQDKAEKVGFVRTLSGRRCRFRYVDGHLDEAHKALNRIIQGSSADQTKTAMVEADRAGFYLQLQIHDELDLSVRDRAEAEALAELMRNVVPLDVPAKVDVEIGPSWGEAK